MRRGSQAWSPAHEIMRESRTFAVGEPGSPGTKLCQMTDRESTSPREGPVVCRLLSPARPNGGHEETHLGGCAPGDGQRPQACQD